MKNTLPKHVTLCSTYGDQNELFLLNTTQKTPHSRNKTAVFYKFRFVSLVAPYLLPSLRLTTISNSPSTVGKSTILLKQSYLLMTWFYYLKYSSTLSRGSAQNGIKFTFLPVKRKKYTLTKAPMAHKTNSKEQLMFQFYSFYVQFKTRLKALTPISSFNHSLLAMFLIRNTFPVFETNLLLLKHSSVFLTTRANPFFTYKLTSSRIQ